MSPNSTAAREANKVALRRQRPKRNPFPKTRLAMRRTRSYTQASAAAVPPPRAQPRPSTLSPEAVNDAMVTFLIVVSRI